jgi:hypothetical protein
LFVKALGMDSHPLIQVRAKVTFPKVSAEILNDQRNAKMVARFREIDAIIPTAFNSDRHEPIPAFRLR